MTGLLKIHDGKITKGTVTLDDRPLDRHRARRRSSAAACAQVLEGRRVFVEMTVEENLRVGAHTARPALKRRTWTASSTLFPVLAERRNADRRLPLRRRAADAGDGPGDDVRPALPAARRAEPGAGAAAGRTGPRRDRRDQHEPAPGCCWWSRTPRWRCRIASHGYVMETGRIVLDKPADALLEDDDVREFYLGLHPGEDAEEHRRRSFRDVKHYRRKKRWSA